MITVKLDMFLAVLYNFTPAMTQTGICLYSCRSISCQININIKSQNFSYLQVLKYRQNWENKGKDKRQTISVLCPGKAYMGKVNCTYVQIKCECNSIAGPLK